MMGGLFKSAPAPKPKPIQTPMPLPPAVDDAAAEAERKRLLTAQAQQRGGRSATILTEPGTGGALQSGAGSGKLGG